ncbi:unnamed protein product [Mytilus edulis]|uniref:Integrase catalytic domain-containing protein n=1 Tax=Mytilus edulis TaxID=6550 RepID=A0A8S3TY35_MYTED|nr:unnamed protein product [Mytilus edulis]
MHDAIDRTQSIDADIFSVCETHLKSTDNLQVDGYTWKGLNRHCIHRNAPKGSGGVGLLIKQWILNEYNCELIDGSFEGIFCVRFTSKSTNFTFTVLSCYLPPETSIWGRDSQGFFAQVLTNIYDQSESDMIILCGDFNSRIGNLKDYSEFDCIPTRNVIDKTKNQHGKSFIEFLNESKMCILNGRYDPVHDDFTCVSGRGKSVVDYICVPHDALKLIESFQVITARSIVENFNLFEFLGERSKVPDHSVILTEFKTYEEANESYQVTSSLPKRYKLNSIPNDFLAKNKDLFLSVASAFQDIFKEGRKPNRIRTDKGQEFRSRNVQRVFQSEGINHFYALNEVKAAISERAIKTIKTRIYRYFAYKQSYKYIDKLQDYAEGYNKTVHRTIDMPPNEVSKQNEESVQLHTLHGNHQRKCQNI